MQVCLAEDAVGKANSALDDQVSSTNRLLTMEFAIIMITIKE
jgi:hypothetical protein